MIETEKRALDVEEFSPTEPLYQENVIRHLVRLASLIVIGLLGVSVVQNYLPEVFTELLSPMLIFALMLVFLAGIFLVFFQLRWVNEKRNKSTNLGGTVGLFGLFLTLISSISSLIAIPLAILIPLLGLGLFLTFVGFFAEMTRVDEPLVFLFRVNLEVIIRYTISIAGAFLVNWSVLSIVVLFLVERGVITIFVLPGDLIGGLIIGGIGVGLVWGSWFHQVNHFIKQTLQAFKDAFVRAAHAFLDFLTNVKNAIVQAFNTLLSFLSRALAQLVQVFSAIVDSIFPIVFGVTSLVVILYGIFVLIYTLITPVGVVLDELFIQIPPVAMIASLKQGSEAQTLIGQFENMVDEGYGLFVIVVAVIFIIVGVMLLLIVVLKKESMQLKSILKTTETQDSPKSGTFKEDVLDSSKKGD